MFWGTYSWPAILSTASLGTRGELTISSSTSFTRKSGQHSGMRGRGERYLYFLYGGHCGCGERSDDGRLATSRQVRRPRLLCPRCLPSPSLRRPSPPVLPPPISPPCLDPAHRLFPPTPAPTTSYPASSAFGSLGPPPVVIQTAAHSPCDLAGTGVASHIEAASTSQSTLLHHHPYANL